MSSRYTDRNHREDRGRSLSRERDSRRGHNSRSASPRRKSQRDLEAEGRHSNRRRSRSYSRDRDIGTSNKHKSHRGSPKRRSLSREDPSHRRYRERSRSRSRERVKARRRSRSSSSNNSSEEDRRRRRKERKREKREKKERKREKKRGKTATHGEEWGKHGIIDESDLYNKNEEFRTWLIEEKMMNHETMSKEDTRRLFKEFVEDYNTATLPHEKYYDMAAYERRMDILRAGATALQDMGGYDINADMMAHSKSHRRAPVDSEAHLSKEQLQELRRVQMQRDQIGKMKILGVNMDSTFGVRMDGNNFEE